MLLFSSSSENRDIYSGKDLKLKSLLQRMLSMIAFKGVTIVIVDHAAAMGPKQKKSNVFGPITYSYAPDCLIWW